MVTRIRSLLIACAVLLPLAFTPEADADRNAPIVRLPRGTSVEHALAGRQHMRLTTVRVLRSARTPRPTRAVSATLGRPSRNRRILTLTAAADAPLGAAYVLQGLVGRRVAMTLKLTVDVVAARSGGAPVPDSGKTVPERAGADTTRRPAMGTLRLGKGARRTMRLEGSRYARLSDVRVLYRGRVVSDVHVGLSTTARGTELRVSATSRMRATTGYLLQGLVDGAWVALPIQITIIERPTAVDASVAGSGGVEALRPSERVVLADGTVVVIGPEHGIDVPGATYEPPVTVTGVSPRRVGRIGSVLTVTGLSLPLDAIAKIGDVSLTLLASSTTELRFRLPASSDACPPAELHLYRGNGTWIDRLAGTYFVKGDKPFHHFRHDKTSHRWINSYLLSLLSLYVYPADIGASGWSDFQAKFRTKAGTLGLNECRFVKVSEPGVDTQVAIAANPEVVVIAFRGSEPSNYSDWVTTDFNMQKKAKNNWKENCWVHAGFYNSYAPAHGQIKTHLDELRTQDQPIFITGHSLGGALSTMCAYRLVRANIPVQGVYTFASPRVGNDKWKSTYASKGLHGRTQRWCNKRDLVPRVPGLPSPGWEHVGKTNNIYEDHKIRLDDDEITMAVKWTLLHHDMKDYIREIYADLKSKTEDESKVPAWSE